jgi:hypothetical protein
MSTEKHKSCRGHGSESQNIATHDVLPFAITEKMVPIGMKRATLPPHAERPHSTHVRDRMRAAAQRDVVSSVK